MSTLELLSEHACFGGVQRFYRHASGAIGLPMQFGVFLPPQAVQGGAKVPVLFYLAGLTCTEETFAIKAGAQQHAARLGLAIVTPDTSPRGTEVPGQSDSWDFGVGAGFYLDATQPLVKIIEQLSKRKERSQVYIKRPGFTIRMQKRNGTGASA